MHLERYRASYGGFEPRVQRTSYTHAPNHKDEHFTWMSVRSDKLKDFPDLKSPDRKFEVVEIDLADGEADYCLEIRPNLTESQRPIILSILGRYRYSIPYGGVKVDRSLFQRPSDNDGYRTLNTFVIKSNQRVKICGTQAHYEWQS